MWEETANSRRHVSVTHLREPPTASAHWTDSSCGALVATTLWEPLLRVACRSQSRLPRMHRRRWRLFGRHRSDVVRVSRTDCGLMRKRVLERAWLVYCRHNAVPKHRG